MQTKRLHRLGQGANENGRAETTDDRLWVVDVGGGHLRVIQGYESLKALIGSYGLPSTTRVFELSAVPKTLGEMPELAPTVQAAAPPAAITPEPEPPAAKVEVAPPAPAPVAVVEPPPPAPVEPVTLIAPVATPAPAPVASVSGVAPATIVPLSVPAPAPVLAPVAHTEPATPHNGSHHDDFSLLDRPFDDGDFFEDPPRRWPKLVGAAAVAAALIGGSYKLLHAHQGAASSHAEVREHEATPPVATPPTPAPPVVAPPPAVAAAPAVPPTPAAVLPAVAAAAAPARPAPAGAPSRAYAELVAEGKRQFDGGHSRKAQALFEQALAETPDGTTAIVGLAYVQLDKGKVPEATKLFEQAVEQDRDYAPAAFGLAESYRQAHSKSAALSEFKRYLTLEPKGDEADIARRFVRELSR